MHAVLSPSAASRWLACTPSARLEQDFPYSTSEAAEEGTLAHSLAEIILKKDLRIISKIKHDAELKKIKKSKYYNDAMLDHCSDYAAFVLEHFFEAKSHTKDATIKLETKLDLTGYVPEGFGTADVQIVADKCLTIIDLKYGKGVSVSAEQNSQLKLYGLGALDTYDYLYDITQVRTIIYQPRLNNISDYSYPVTYLKEWAAEYLIPRANLAFKGEGEFIAGSHCQFCKVRASCRTNAELQLEIAKYDFMDVKLLSDEETADILDRADCFKKWISAVEENALFEATKNGKKWPGYKLVEGRSNRIYSDEKIVAGMLIARHIPTDAIYNSKLKGLTEMEKVLGKNDFSELIVPLLIKPPGKPTLVPESDKRPELNSAQSATEAFADIEID